MKSINLKDAIDRDIGEIGTPERDEFERELTRAKLAKEVGVIIGKSTEYVLWLLKFKPQSQKVIWGVIITGIALAFGVIGWYVKFKLNIWL